MCRSCWESYGSPDINNEKVESAVALLKRLDRSGSCGHLHCVVDDWNIEDEHLLSAERAISGYERDEDTEIQRECLVALQILTLDERASALAISQGITTQTPA